ncbi:MAG: hypothetical protein J6331_08490 [Lentisphaeria bacterium]|nr:hypothetical protein [Lentisphaeria bacterium]
MKLYAFAVEETKTLSPTLGKSTFLLLLDENGREKAFSPVEKSLVGQLKALETSALFCGGIGNCSRMLLEDAGVTVLYGCVEKEPARILQEYKAGVLAREKDCFCTSSGRSCGECPGKF